MLARQRISRLRNLVPRTPDFNNIAPDLYPHGRAQQRHIGLPFLLFTRRTPCQIGLMLAALGVSEIRAIVLVHGKAKPAFEGANVVFEEERVFV
jgi:hypothetical protein